jgi:hypothetical protein
MQRNIKTIILQEWMKGGTARRNLLREIGRAMHEIHMSTHAGDMELLQALEQVTSCVESIFSGEFTVSTPGYVKTDVGTGWLTPLAAAADLILLHRAVHSSRVIACREVVGYLGYQVDPHRDGMTVYHPDPLRIVCPICEAAPGMLCK